MSRFIPYVTSRSTYWHSSQVTFRSWLNRPCRAWVQDRGRNPEVASPLPQDVDSSGKGDGTERTECNCSGISIRRWLARLLTKWSSCGGEVCEYIPPCGPTGPRWRATWLSAWFLNTFMASSSRSSIRAPCTNRIPKMRLDYAPIVLEIVCCHYILF